MLLLLLLLSSVECSFSLLSSFVVFDHVIYFFFLRFSSLSFFSLLLLHLSAGIPWGPLFDPHLVAFWGLLSDPYAPKYALPPPSSERRLMAINGVSGGGI